MYAEPGLMLPFAQGFPQLLSGGDQHLLSFPVYEDLVSMNLPPDAPSNMGNLFQTSAISEYDLGGDGDLFNAPKPILEESLISLDPVAAAISMISGYGSTITEQTLEISDMESIPNEDLLNEVFNDCKNDLLAKPTMGVATPQESDITVAAVQTEESVEGKDTSFADGPLQKSISFGRLSSGDCANVSSVKPCLLGLHEMNLEAALGMRRAYSEGDIQVFLAIFTGYCRSLILSFFWQILGINNSVHGNMNSFPSFKLLATIEDVKIEDKIEERRKKLSRYRKKRTKRNYGRKIKYACRKALADSQPRIRGRFAKMEDRHANTGQCEEAK